MSAQGLGRKWSRAASEETMVARGGFKRVGGGGVGWVFVFLSFDQFSKSQVIRVYF